MLVNINDTEDKVSVNHLGPDIDFWLYGIRPDSWCFENRISVIRSDSVYTFFFLHFELRSDPEPDFFFQPCRIQGKKCWILIPGVNTSF